VVHTRPPRAIVAMVLVALSLSAFPGVAGAASPAVIQVSAAPTTGALSPTTTPAPVATAGPTATATLRPTATPTKVVTPTPTERPTSTPTKRPLPTPTPTRRPPPTPTAHPKPKPTTRPKPLPTKRPRPTPTRRPRPTPTRHPRPTPTRPHPTPTKAVGPSKRRHPGPKRSATPTPTRAAPRHDSTVSPVVGQTASLLAGAAGTLAIEVGTAALSRSTPPPPVALGDLGDAQDPIYCPARQYPIARPFLLPPYHGFVRVDSYFDHDYPDFHTDDRLTIANGMTFSTGGDRLAPVNTPQSPAPYWSQALRQYVYYDGHNGYDFELVYQPIYAAAAGKVLFAAWNLPGYWTEGYGRMVIVDDGHGYATLYGHLSKIGVHVGEPIKAGQELGISGNSGHSTGPHLHFTVFHNCHSTDPYGWTGSGVDPLTGYESESSAYLWREAPRILNPIPNWPGSADIPAPATPEALDLALPTEPTLKRFLSRLDEERIAVSAALKRRAIPVHYDWRAAAFLFPKPVKPGTLDSLPAAASVTPDTPYDISGATQSFDASLARLLPTLSRARRLTGGPWRASVFRFGGRVYLLGRGPANQTIEFRILHSAAIPVGVVSNANGAFAIPIATPVTDRSRFELVSSSGPALLHPAGARTSQKRISPQPTRVAPLPGRGAGRGISPNAHPSTPRIVENWVLLMPGALLLGFLGLCVLRFRRRRTDASRATGNETA
jgi:murein DD-endopeptidase MepM/ murein hydrolase activator NlpD